MKLRIMKAWTLILVAVLVMIPLAACSSTAPTAAPTKAPTPAPTVAPTEAPTPAPTPGDLKVTFDLNYDGADNTAIPAQTVKPGALAASPAEPVRDDYAFEGWYTDKEATKAFDFAAAAVSADTTLYAGWSKAVYYIAGNFTGYEAKMAGFSLKTFDGKDGWYWITINLTDEVRDKTYNGHYYKITDGTWNTDGCWGAANYALQPAPAAPDNAGLGSVYIAANCTLTVLFDSVNKVVYDDSMVRAFKTPRIYGDFNAAMSRGADWSTADGEALELADPDGDGVYSGLYDIPAYTGTGANGYSMVLALSEKYYIGAGYNAWGANEQYLFDGTAGGMGKVSNLKPDAKTVYEFVYDSKTHVTAATALKADQINPLAGPTVYGDFSTWLFEGPTALLLKDDDGDGVFTGTLKLAAYSGKDKGYMLVVALSKKLYNDQYGIRWGAEEQYLFDGNPAAMGSVSFLKPTKETTYTLSYDSKTHKTTVK